MGEEDLHSDRRRLEVKRLQAPKLAPFYWGPDATFPGPGCLLQAPSHSTGAAGFTGHWRPF